MRNNAIKVILFTSFFLLILFSPFAICMDFSSGFKEIGTIADGSDIINARYIDNNIAFLAEINRNVLGVYDISDARNCVELDAYSLSYMHDIDLDTDRNLLFITASNGVNIFDYSDPSDLDRLSVYYNYTSSTFIYLVGELLFIGAEDAGLQIVDVSDPYNPVMISHWDDDVGHVGPLYVIEDYQYDGSISGNGTGNDMDDFAFVQTRLPNVGAPPTILDMKMLNVTDPTNVTFIQIMNVDEEHIGSVPNYHEGNLLFFKDYEFGLRIINFTDPFNITVLGTFYDEGLYNDFIILDGTTAFIADDEFGLKVVNCTNLANPSLISSHELDWRTIRVAVEDDRVYLATLGGGVRILSVQRNQIPIPLSFILMGLILGCVFVIFKMKRNDNTAIK